MRSCTTPPRGAGCLSASASGKGRWTPTPRSPRPRRTTGCCARATRCPTRFSPSGRAEVADFRIFTDWRNQPLLVNVDRVVTISPSHQGGADLWFGGPEDSSCVRVRGNWDALVEALASGEEPSYRARTHPPRSRQV